MEFPIDINVKKVFVQAGKRIDGIVMYIVCCFFLLLTLYAFIAPVFDFPLFLLRWKVIWGSILLVPITVIFYVSLAYFSSSGIVSRIVNAILLLGIPFLFIYKSIN